MKLDYCKTCLVLSTNQEGNLRNSSSAFLENCRLVFCEAFSESRTSMPFFVSCYRTLSTCANWFVGRSCGVSCTSARSSVTLATAHRVCCRVSARSSVTLATAHRVCCRVSARSSVTLATAHRVCCRVRNAGSVITLDYGLTNSGPSRFSF